jgi:hypothetical protein
MRARTPWLLGFAVASVANGLALEACAPDCRDRTATTSIPSTWVADHAVAIESGILDMDRQNARTYDDGRDAGVIIERDPHDPNAFAAPTATAACAPDAYMFWCKPVEECVRFEVTGRFCTIWCSDVCAANSLDGIPTSCRTDRNDAGALQAVLCTQSLRKPQECYPSQGNTPFIKEI